MPRRSNHGKRSNTGRFLRLPHSVIASQSFIGLRGNAAKLLIQISAQYNGRNNGDLTVAYGFMKSRGWRSKSTLSKAVSELVDAGLIVKTRDGYFRNPGARCDLYAITWENIDECPGKDLGIGPTDTPYRKFSFEDSILPSPKDGLGSVQKSGRERLRDDRGRFRSASNKGR